MRLLRRQAEEKGTTVVMVTHDGQAARVGSRLIVIRDGRIEADDPVHFQNPPDAGQAVSAILAASQTVKTEDIILFRVFL